MAASRHVLRLAKPSALSAPFLASAPSSLPMRAFSTSLVSREQGDKGMYLRWALWLTQ